MGVMDVFEMDVFEACSNYARALNIDKGLSIRNLPWFSLPPGYSFQVTFPFGGAAARFRVRKDTTGAWVSVYLDTVQALGCWDGPYWEVYPIDGDVKRWSLGDEAGMMSVIIRNLDAAIDGTTNDKEG